MVHKEQRRVETALKISGLPFIKSIDEFDFSFQPKLDRRKVMSLFDLTFIREKGNVIFLGPPGVGKTHLAVVAGAQGLPIRHEHLFYQHGRPHQEAEKRPGCRPARAEVEAIINRHLVIVDEVGYTPIDRDECNLFFRFIANRYEKASTIITSNKVFSDWTELFHDPVIVTAFLDRLLHHSVVINIRGSSYRLRGKVGEASKKDPS